MSEAREEVLARVRAAGGDGAAGRGGERIPPLYRRTSEAPAEEIVALFAERVADYRASVSTVVEREVPAALAEACTRHGAKRLAVPADLPSEWRPEGPELVEDADLSHEELGALDGVITGCALAIAETGTFVLDSGPAQGRRAITLLPDLHLCVVREEQIVGLVPEALDRLREAVQAEGRPVTFVSGPSATSDIELERVEGVHGPRKLEVIIVSASR